MFPPGCTQALPGGQETDFILVSCAGAAGQEAPPAGQVTGQSSCPPLPHCIQPNTRSGRPFIRVSRIQGCKGGALHG